MMCLAKLEEKLRVYKESWPELSRWMELVLSFFYMPEVFHYISKEQEIDAILCALSGARRVSAALEKQDAGLLARSVFDTAVALCDISGRDFEFFMDQMDSLDEMDGPLKPPADFDIPALKYREANLLKKPGDTDSDRSRIHECIKEDYKQLMKDARAEFIRDLGINESIPAENRFIEAEDSYAKLSECISILFESTDDEALVVMIEKEMVQFATSRFIRDLEGLSLDEKVRALCQKVAMAQFAISHSNLAIKRLERQQVILKDEQIAIKRKCWRQVAYVEDLVKASTRQAKEIRSLRQELTRVKAQAQESKSEPLGTQIISALMRDLRLSDGVKSTLNNVLQLFTNRERIYQEMITQKNLEVAAFIATIQKMRQAHAEAVKSSTASIFSTIHSISSAMMTQEVQQSMQKLMIWNGIAPKANTVSKKDATTSKEGASTTQNDSTKIALPLQMVAMSFLTALSLLEDLTDEIDYQVYEQDLGDLMDYGIKLKQLDSGKLLATFEKQSEKLSTQLVNVSEDIRKWAIGDSGIEMQTPLLVEQNLTSFIEESQNLAIENVLTLLLKKGRLWCDPLPSNINTNQASNDFGFSRKIVQWFSPVNIKNSDKVFLGVDILQEICLRLVGHLELSLKKSQKKLEEELEAKDKLEKLLVQLGEPLDEFSENRLKVSTMLKKLTKRLQDSHEEKVSLEKFIEGTFQSIENGSRNIIEKPSSGGLPEKLYELAQKFHQKEAELRVSAMVLIQNFESCSDTPLDKLSTTSLLKLLESNIGQVILDEKLFRNAIGDVLERLDSQRINPAEKTQSAEALVGKMEEIVNERLEDIRIAEVLMNAIYGKILDTPSAHDSQANHSSKSLREVSKLLSNSVDAISIKNNGNEELISRLNQLLEGLGLDSFQTVKEQMSKEDVDKVALLIESVSIPLRCFSKDPDVGSEAELELYAERKISAVQLARSLISKNMLLEESSIREHHEKSKMKDGFVEILRLIDAPNTMLNQSYEEQIQHIEENLSNERLKSWQEEKTYMEVVEKTLKNFIVCLCDSIDIDETFVIEALKTWDFPSILLRVFEKFNSRRNLLDESSVLYGKLVKELRAEGVVADLLRNELSRLITTGKISQDDVEFEVNFLLERSYSRDRRISTDEIFDENNHCLSDDVPPPAESGLKHTSKTIVLYPPGTRADDSQSATSTVPREGRNGARGSNSISISRSHSPKNSYDDGSGKLEKPRASPQASARTDRPKPSNLGATRSERSTPLRSAANKAERQPGPSNTATIKHKRPSNNSGNNRSNTGYSDPKEPIRSSTRETNREKEHKPSIKRSDDSEEQKSSNKDEQSQKDESKSSSSLLNSYSQYFNKSMVGEAPSVTEPDVQELEVAGKKFYYSRISMKDLQMIDAEADGNGSGAAFGPERPPPKVFGPERPPQMAHRGTQRQ